MGEISIFQGAMVPATKRGISDLGRSMAAGGGISRRIQTNTNGTFKRLVNGEQIGNAVRGEINVIIVGALNEVSRVYYAKAYDPNGEATLPDCWSNLGKVPEAAAGNKQASSCTDCPQNVKGSGANGGRACRYQRRIAVLLEGDPTGDVYQMNIPSKSLFGKGSGNVHPFESYVRYVVANNESPDTVVTNVSYNLNADSMELLFTPQRNLSDAEYERVQEAQKNPDTARYLEITVAQASNVAKKPATPAPAKAAPIVSSDEPDDEEVAQEPVKRPSASRPAAPVVASDLSAAIDAWASDDAE
jgi:hypothetical protein